MGWGVTVNGVYLSKMHTSKLESLYEDNVVFIDMMHKQILLLAAGTPREVAFESNYIVTWEEYVCEEIDNALEAIKEASGQNFVIGQILCEHSEVTAKDT